MSTKLLQLKITPILKRDLEKIAEFKGISVTAWVKLSLTESTRKEKKQILSENGLTEAEEMEVLRREKEALQDYKKGKLKALSIEKLIKELNA